MGELPNMALTTIVVMFRRSSGKLSVCKSCVGDYDLFSQAAPIVLWVGSELTHVETKSPTNRPSECANPVQRSDFEARKKSAQL